MKFVCGYIALVTLYCVVLTVIGSKPKPTDSICSTKESCGACIQELGCSWCSKPEVSGPRCLTLASQTLADCGSKHNVAPITTFTVMQDEPLRAAPRRPSDPDAVQIRPQKLRATLRVGEEIRIKVQYQQAQDYPVDLYYLMDLSASMEDDKDKLSTLAQSLAQVMANITDNFRLGFGSFVDKTTHPFINTSPQKMISPCTLQSGLPCAPPYSYKNHLSLTSNYELFAQEVRSAPVSGNLDTPEGGLDALAQVIVCSDKIGWRRKARRLVVYATDSGFHMAGDGKLGGIVLRNDMQCHLDSTGMYTHDLEQDYPSISQINSLAKEHNVNIIFAIAGQSAAMTSIYSSMKDAVHGAAYGKLTRDSSNVVDLVRAEYEKIVDSVSLSDNSDEYISVKYYSSCNSSSMQSPAHASPAGASGEGLRETRECGGLRGREVVEFEVAVTAVRCPPGPAGLKKVHIKPAAVDESLVMELEVYCECDCERKGAPGYQEHSKACNNAGTSRCGVCACSRGRYGRHCECDSESTSKTDGDEYDISGCRPDNTTDVLCSNHGACKCNKCTCHPRRDPAERHYGAYCECDNFSCPRSDGAVCGGAGRGRCDCGRCSCLAGWGGAACDCPVGNEPCVDPDTGLVCSGRGKCVCGRCECSTVQSSNGAAVAHKYSGRYCSECSSCPSLRCDELRHCVECKAYGTGKYGRDECNDKCTEFTPEILDSITPELEQDTSTNYNNEHSNPRKYCRVPDQSGCVIVFDYRFVSTDTDKSAILEVAGLSTRKKLEVRAQKDKECGEPVDMLAVILGVVGSILLAGLVMLLIWKLLTTMHDKREYARFEKERAEAKWPNNENPIYKPATTTYHNVAFGRRSMLSK